MAITDANVLTGQAAQIAQSMFQPATNILSSALNNAVDMGRRMVDLQSHQEDIFMSEREKLRLANERKGLEARRIFENDRNFGEDVLRDRRNFDEGVRRNDRDFGLESAYKMGSLGLQQKGLGLERSRLELSQDDFILREQEQMSRDEVNRARAAVYEAQAKNGGYRSAAGYKPNSFIEANNEFLRQHGGYPTGDPLILPTNPKQPITDADREVARADAAKRKAYSSLRLFPQREVRAAIGFLPKNLVGPVSERLGDFAPDRAAAAAAGIFNTDFNIDATGFDVLDPLSDGTEGLPDPNEPGVLPGKGSLRTPNGW